MKHPMPHASMHGIRRSHPIKPLCATLHSGPCATARGAAKAQPCLLTSRHARLSCFTSERRVSPCGGRPLTLHATALRGRWSHSERCARLRLTVRARLRMGCAPAAALSAAQLPITDGEPGIWIWKVWLARLLLSGRAACWAVAVRRSAMAYTAPHAGPRVPPLVPRVPRRLVVLRGLLGGFTPSLPSGRTTTGESRCI